MNSYSIKTIKDITDIITDKNIEVFTQDFKIFLELVIESKKSKNNSLLNTMVKDIFRWNDDNKVGLKTVRITVINKP